MFLIFIASSFIFLYFFWQINFLYGVYLVGFFLSLIIVLSLFSDDGKSNWKEFIKSFFLEYITYVNFAVIGLGVYFMLKYFVGLYFSGLLVDIKVLMIMLFTITALSILAIILNKKNFLKVTFTAISVIFALLYFFVKDINVFYYYIAYMNALATVGFLIYSSIYGKFNKYLAYVIFIYSFVVFFILLSKFLISSSIILSFVIQFVIFVLLLFVIYVDKLNKKLIDIKNKLKEKEHEMRLFGYSELKLDKEDEKFLEKYKKHEPTIKFFVDFFINSPKQVKILFSLTNTIPIVLASWFFFHQLESVTRIQNEIFYWLGAIMYFVNFLLFKKLDWFVVIQRLFAFFVINFVTYFTIIDFSGQNYLYIAIGGIIWNLFATVIILFLDKKHNTFDAMDYLIWSVVNFIGVFVNIYFLFKIGLNYYLSIGIALLYLGLYLYLYRIVYKKQFLEN